ncbi:hypothetical protein [Streptomyces sp. ID05-18]|uniref:hypothetical protein n=1 Tax=Streptomyces sp. ID05-18 TaxID=3028662 RepID=UPI0029B3EA5C|nr:hypothetical protein [Streptomyces sp. ID05-18]MDX3490944.1 hypothetical protein [Streptomyces sp. ID05-18]
MSTEKRLSADDLVDEIRSSLAMTTGWIPVLSGLDGPPGVSEGASLSEIAQALGEFADAAAILPAVAQQLCMASESVTAASEAEGATAYGHLGSAYAHVLQARRVASDDATRNGHDLRITDDRMKP